MNLIFEVFKELNYVFADEFVVEYKIDKSNIMQVTVNVLILKENDSQVFLLVNCDNRALQVYVEGSLIKEIAFQFRKKEYHRAEMDRNTSLLIISKQDVDEALDTSSKVKKEDDHYYFKK